MSSHSRLPTLGGDDFPHQRTLEALYGEDFSGVDVTTGESSALAAIGAGGLASGESVAVASQTPTLELMAHELAHVVQHRNSGPAQASLTSAPGDSAEREAVAAESAAAAGQPIAISSAPTGALQGDWGTGALIGGVLGSAFGPGGAILGGAVGGMIQHALSDDEEVAPTQSEPAPAKAPEPAAPVAAAPGPLNAQWANHEDVYQGTHKVADPKQKVGNLSTPEARTGLLNQFTQNASKEADPGGQGNERCGATVLIAAAIQGGGTEGVQCILDQAKADLPAEGDPRYEKQKAKLDAIEKSMKGGELSMGDLTNLTMVVNDQLMESQAQFYQGKVDEQGNPIMPPLAGLDPQFLKAYIEKNKTMKDYFADGSMSIDSVDSDGTSKGPSADEADHYVLHFMNGETNAIYDPFAHKDGNQVVTDPALLQAYSDHEHKPDQIDGADFGGNGFKGAYN